MTEATKSSKKRLYRCSPFINGSAYCGMMRENDHGSFGPEFVGPGPYYVAEEADAEIERLTAQVNDAMQGEADATEAYRAQIERLRAALSMDAPWPLPDVLEKLVEAVEHLLSAHSCDTHGYESYVVAIACGKAVLGNLRAGLRGGVETPGTPGGVQQMLDIKKMADKL